MTMPTPIEKGAEDFAQKRDVAELRLYEKDSGKTTELC
jgi:hypothetical protein